MAFRLNRTAIVRLNALVAQGKFVDKAWSFTAADSNTLLGDDNWTDFGNWFLATDDQQPSTSKAHYSYPFGKGGQVNLSALRAIVTRASQQGARDVADAASAALAQANARKKDQASASSDRNNLQLRFNADVNITAAADASDGKAAGPARFDMIAYTGGAMKLKGWQYPVVVDLEGIEGTDKPLPALSDHDMSREGIVGHLDKIEVTKGAGGNVTAEGVISGAGAAAAQVEKSGKQGFPWQASIGAQVLKNQFVPEGQTAMANGQVWQGPINIARRSSLGEISFVPRGADTNTSARVAAKTAAGADVMTFEQWLEARGLELADLNDAAQKTLRAAFDAETIEAAADPNAENGDGKDGKGKRGKKAPAAKPRKVAAAATDENDDDNEDLAITAKSTRREILAEAAKTQKHIVAISKICKDHPDLQVKAFDEDWSTERTELEVLRASRPKNGGSFGINTGAKLDERATVAAISAACSISAGITQKVAFEGLADPVKELAASRQFRGMGLHQLMFMCAQANGIHGTPGKVDNDFLKALLYNDQQHIVQAANGGSFSTLSLSGVLENILNKAMLQSYGDVPSVVPQIAYETDTNDFKQYGRYRLTASGAMQPVGPDGELKNMSAQDESYKNQVTTQGAIINIGRDKLINDDMGSLTQLPGLIGRQAAIAREKAVFNAVLGNAASFFSSGNKNFASGGGSALSISSLTTAEQKFLEQKDANGDPIMLMPDRLLVPPALKVTAENLFNGANLVVSALGSTSSKTVEPDRNPHEGKYEPIISPFLGAQGGLTGNSDTGWYLLPNPSGGMAVVSVGYLRGQRTPIIERGESNFNTLGISLRGYYDFGVALHDNRCGVFSAGA